MQTGKVIDYIVDWLAGYCEQAKVNGFAVGISGGIDSAVTSALCAKTGKTVYALAMPIRTPPEQMKLAEDHLSWLAARYPNVCGVIRDLSPVFASMEENLPQQVQDGLTMANTRSRLRMVTLYAYASHYRLLVAGTGNKVEDFGVGFFTKYGDGGVDISPIADLMKSEVYEAGRELDIIDGILKAQPTDGLWADNRSDADQIGASYDELEWAMRFLEAPADEARLGNRQQEVLSIYRRLHAANRHKMTPIPVAEIPEELKQ
ncbi:MAG: NAD(+) synthase [Desulfosalsimonadaceae bacterium]